MSHEENENQSQVEEVKANPVQDCERNMEEVETFACPICLEDECSDVVRNPNCSHIICNDCLTDHCQHELSIQKVPFLCPYGCRIQLPLAIVKDMLTRRRTDDTVNDETDLMEDWDKYRRLLVLSRDKTIRECPGCDELVNKSDSTNDMACSHCELAFCFLHGMIHRGMTCDEYQRTPQGRELEETELTLLQYTKPCSHCGTAIQKSYGCGYVVCSSCHNGMCYTCGTHIHLRGTDGRPLCTRCKHEYVDHRYDTIRRIRLILALPFLIPVLIVLYIAIALCDLLLLALTSSTEVLESDRPTVLKTLVAISTILGVVAFIPVLLLFLMTLFLLYCLGLIFRQEFILDFAVKTAFGNDPPRFLRRGDDRQEDTDQGTEQEVQPQLDPPRALPSQFRVSIFWTFRPFFVILDEFGIPASRAVLNIPANEGSDPIQIEIPSLPVVASGDSNV